MLGCHCFFLIDSFWSLNISILLCHGCQIHVFIFYHCTYQNWVVFVFVFVFRVKFIHVSVRFSLLVAFDFILKTIFTTIFFLLVLFTGEVREESYRNSFSVTARIKLWDVYFRVDFFITLYLIHFFFVIYKLLVASVLS